MKNPSLWNKTVNNLLEPSRVTKEKINKKIQEKIISGELVTTKVARYSNKLVIFPTGKVEYILKPLEVFEAKFNVKSSPFKLLLLMSQRPNTIYSFEELSKGLKPARQSADNASDESRVRNSIQTIRKKLKLPEGVEIFKVDYGYGLACDVELRT